MTIIQLLFLYYTSSSSVPNIFYVKKFIVTCSVWSTLFSGSIHFHYITLSHSIFSLPLAFLYYALSHTRHTRARSLCPNSPHILLFCLSFFLFFNKPQSLFFFPAITLSFPVACFAPVVGHPTALHGCPRTTIRWGWWSYNHKQHTHCNAIIVSPRYRTVLRQ